MDKWTIDKELILINTRARQIYDEVGIINPDLTAIDKWLEDIKKATQNINNQINTK